MICYDREFPETARILMLQGVELILVPNACEMEENRTGQLRARAYENMVGVALTNYAATPHFGHSVAFDGMAFTADGQSRDTTLVRAGEDEGVYIATFNLENLREYRAREKWGNAFRRPRYYHPLISPQVEPPFVRPEARR
jgi:predicted amidohydrolase